MQSFMKSGLIMKKILLSLLFLLISTSLSLAGEHEHAHIGLDLNVDMLSHYLEDIAEGSSVAFWALMVITFVFGALHSLIPGHGNIVVASYFTSQDAKISHGLIMAAIIAIVHVFSALAVVFGTDIALSSFVEDGHVKGIDVIEAVSYFAIFAIGLFMLRMAYKSYNSCLCCANTEHNERKAKNKSYWFLAVSVGLVPCASSLLVLFFALSQDMLALGVYMVLSMSVGIGVALAIVGVASIVARKRIIINRVSKGASSKLSIIVRYAGSLIITLFGLISLINILLEMNGHRH